MGLLDIRGWHASAALLKIALELFEGLRLDRRGLLQRRGNGLTSQVVLGWSQATCGQDEVRALQGASEAFGEHSQTVTDDRDPLQLNPQRRQPRRHPGGVRICELAHEQFRTNGEDFGFHAHAPWVLFRRQQQHPDGSSGPLAAQRTEGPTACQESVTGPCGTPIHCSISWLRVQGNRIKFAPRFLTSSDDPSPHASAWLQCPLARWSRVATDATPACR